MKEEREHGVNSLKKPLFWAYIANYVYWLILFLVVIISVPFPPELQVQGFFQLGVLLLCILIMTHVILLLRLPDNKSGLKSKAATFLFLFVSTIYILLGGYTLFVLLSSLDFLYSASPMRFMAIAGSGLFPVGILIFVLSLFSLAISRKPGN